MPAIVALPDLALVIAGLLLVAIAYGLYLLRDLIQSAFSHIPWIGGWIGGHIGGLIEDAGNLVMSAADAAFGGAERLFRGIAHWATTMFDEVISGAASVLITVEHVVTSQIPRAFDAARAFIVAQANAVYSDALGWYHDALGYADRAVAAAERDAAAAVAAVASGLADVRSWAVSSFDTVRHDLAADFDAAVSWTDAKVAQAVSWAAAAIAAAEAGAQAYALSLFHAAEHDIGAALTAAEGYAAAAAAAAEHDARVAVDVAASAGLAIPWAGIITDLDSLEQTMGNAWRDIRDAVGAIPRAVPADLAGALTAVAALAIPALRAMDDCVLPQCRDLGGLRSFLHDLMSAASAAAVLAWLAYCVAEPVPAADDTYAIGGPVAADTLGLLERLFGVAT